MHFRTYATAAIKAFDKRLIDGRAARRVLEAVEADMARDAENLAPGSANAQLLQAELAAAHSALDKRGPLTGAKNLLGRWRKQGKS